MNTALRVSRRGGVSQRLKRTGPAAFVQMASSGNVSGAVDATATLGTPAIAGNLLVALFAFDQIEANAGTIPPASWTMIGEYSATDPDDYTALWAKLAVGGETAITHTAGSTAAKTFTVLEVSAAQVVGNVHVAEGGSQGANTDFPVGPVAALANDLVVFFWATTAGSLPTPVTPAGYTARGSVGRMVVYTKAISAGGNEEPAVRWSNAVFPSFNAHVVVLKNG